jgi:hypothetical protein
LHEAGERVFMNRRARLGAARRAQRLLGDGGVAAAVHLDAPELEGGDPGARIARVAPHQLAVVGRGAHEIAPAPRLVRRFEEAARVLARSRRGSRRRRTRPGDDRIGRVRRERPGGRRERQRWGGLGARRRPRLAGAEPVDLARLRGAAHLDHAADDRHGDCAGRRIAIDAELRAHDAHLHLADDHDEAAIVIGHDVEER